MSEFNASAARVWDDIAASYGKQIISPLLHSVSNPLMKQLKKMAAKKNKLVADFGCGNGNLIPYLAARFKHTYAIDFSKEMLAHTQLKIETLNEKLQSKVECHLMPMHKLQRLNLKLDVAIAVNSILETHPVELKKIFQAISDSIKARGQFLGVFPALESIQEEYHYTYQKELRKYKSNALAQKATNKKLQIERVDFKLGTYHTDDMLQKYFTQYELHNFLTSVGFKNCTFERIIYKQGHSYNYVDRNLVNHPPMWDWFVWAKK